MRVIYIFIPCSHTKYVYIYIYMIHMSVCICADKGIYAIYVYHDIYNYTYTDTMFVCISTSMFALASACGQICFTLISTCIFVLPFVPIPWVM